MIEPFACVFIITNEKNEVLATARRNDHSQVGLVGGKRDPGESAIHCALRETMEETGVEVTRSVVLYQTVDDTGNLVQLFYAQEWKNEPRQMETDIPVRWVSWETLMNPDHSPWAVFNRKAYETWCRMNPAWDRP